MSFSYKHTLNNFQLRALLHKSKGGSPLDLLMCVTANSEMKVGIH